MGAIMKNIGKLIVVEGLDGSGKGTQIALLKEKLEAAGRKVIATAEPTQSAAGGLCRDALKGRFCIGPRELAALFTADRIGHNTDKSDGIVSLLERGIDVICDRYYYSTCAYQGMESERDMKWTMDMNRNCPVIRKPDICLFLDLDPESCLQRIQKGRVSTEIYEKTEILKRVRQSFMQVFSFFSDETIIIVDSDAHIKTVSERIWNAVNENLFDN